MSKGFGSGQTVPGIASEDGLLRIHFDEGRIRGRHTQEACVREPRMPRPSSEPVRRERIGSPFGGGRQRAADSFASHVFCIRLG